ncbi:MAG TPA: alpha/beta hydrolase [Jatrophihabitans sp.]|nr:alpha/beta hydrolase [Jatrophihabitans sp.]
MRERDLQLPDGGTLHCYDSESGGLPVFWQHGTPNVGEPPVPLEEAAQRLGVRWVSFDRPGYGGSSPQPDRTLGSTADWVQAVATELELDRFAFMGHSGGSSHALAAAARLPGQTRAVVSVAALAPFDAAGLDWFSGMAPAGVAGLTAAAAGRAAKEEHEASADAPPAFTEADVAMFSGPWRWLGSVAGRGMANGPDPLIDDDLAYVRPWGCAPADISVPVLLVHGDQDEIVPAAHSRWLAQQVPGAELWLQPGDGHISVLSTAESALRWLVEHA